jgi:hypothetical protein
MASHLKRPALETAAPPFFEFNQSHSVKVFHADTPVWVKVLTINGDEVIGQVRDQDVKRDAGIGPRDVIEFKLCHVFGVY